MFTSANGLIGLSGSISTGGSYGLSQSTIEAWALRSNPSYYLGQLIVGPHGVPSLGLGSVLTKSFNSSTGIVTGTFSGDELIALGSGQNFAVYAVTGSFTDTVNLSTLGPCTGIYSGDTCGTTGVGQITISSTRYLGNVSFAPEPETLVMMGTGLCGIGTVLRRKLKQS